MAVIGFLDDAGAAAATMAVVQAQARDEHPARAPEWLGWKGLAADKRRVISR